MKKSKMLRFRNARFAHFVIGLFAVSFAAIMAVNPSHALVGVGNQIDCFSSPTVGFGNFGLDSNDSEAQTFTLSTSAVISAVKINAYRYTASDGFDSLNVHIADVTPATTAGLPDYNNIHATETWNTELLPVWDNAVFSNNDFSCDPDVDTGQVVIFDPPVALASGTYAFIIDGVVGIHSGGNDMVLAYDIPAVDYYSGGNHIECGVPTSCTRTTPATWDLTGGAHDVYGMAWYDNVTIVAPQNVDQWLNNFLSSMGLNSVMGKALFAIIVFATASFALLFRKAPPLIVMGMAGMLIVPVAAADLLDANIILTMIGIIGIALMYAAVRGLNRGTD